MAAAIDRINVAFPSLSAEQLALIKDRMIVNGFGDDRAMAAVNHVIDSFDSWSRTPAVADFIKYDKRVKTYTHSEMCDACLDGELVPVDMGGKKPRWAKKEDLGAFGLKRWEV